MITVKLIPNIFVLEDRVTWWLSTDKIPGKALTLTDLQLDRASEYVDLWLDGVVVDPKDFAITPVSHSAEIVLFARPGPPAIALIGVLGSILSAMSGAGIGIGFLGISATVLGYIGAGLTVLSGIASMIMAASADTPAVTNSANFKSNKNYGWDGAITEYAAGTMLPVPYGRIFCAGKVISQRIYSNASNDQAMDMLICLGEGPIRGIRRQDGSGICAWSRVNVPGGIASGTTITVDSTLGFDASEILQGEETAIAVAVELNDGLMHRTTIASITNSTVFELALAIPAANTVPDNAYVFTYPKPWVTLEKNFVSNLTDISWDFRPGVLDQPMIPKFSDSYTTESDYQEIQYKDEDGNEDWYEITNIGGADGVDAVELNFAFPSGLYSMDSATGDMNTYSAKIRVEWKKSSVNTWAGASSYEHRWAKRKLTNFYQSLRFPNATSYWENDVYDMRIKRLDKIKDSRYKHNRVYLHSYVKIVKESFKYPGTVLLSISATATDQLSSAQPNLNVQLDGRTLGYYDGASWLAETWDTRSFGASTTVSFDGHRISKTGGVDLTTVFALYSKFNVYGSTDELNDGEFTITAVSADYIDVEEDLETQSAGPAITLFCDDGNVARNPAWQMHDFCYNTVYGLGNYLSSEWKQSIAFKNLADHANELVPDGRTGKEPRFRSDVVIDGGGNGWDLIKELLSSCHSYPVAAGGQIWPQVEKARSPIIALGMASVKGSGIQSTLRESWKSIDDMPNLIEVQYFDSAQNGQRDVVQYPDDDSELNTGQIRKRSIVFHNITRRTQAKRVAKYHYLIAKYIRHAIEFSSGEEALGLQPGDVFYFSHTIPQMDYSGEIFRVRSTTELELDNDWDDCDLGATLRLLVRSATATETVEGALISKMEIMPLTSATRENDRLVVEFAAPFSFTVADGDSYILIVDATTPKKYICTDLGRDADFSRSIKGMEYNAAIYTYDDSIIDIPVLPDPPNPNDVPSAATDLVLLVSPLRNGVYVDATLPTNEVQFSYARIWYCFQSADAELTATIPWGGEFRTIDDVFIPANPGSEITVKIQCFNRNGVGSTTVEASACIGGSYADIPTPTGLQVFGKGNEPIFDGRDCRLMWRKNSNFLGIGTVGLGEEPAGLGQGAREIVSYLVSVKVAGNVVREELLTVPEFVYTYEKNHQDNGGVAQRTFTVEVRQGDSLGNVSANPAVISVSNPAPDMSAVWPSLVGSMTGLLIDWTHVIPTDSDLLRYEVYCDTNASPTTLVGIVAHPTTKFLLTGLNAGVGYYVKIVPYDAFGVGEDSVIVTETVDGIDTPMLVDGAVTTPITVFEASGIALPFDPPGFDDLLSAEVTVLNAETQVLVSVTTMYQLPGGSSGAQFRLYRDSTNLTPTGFTYGSGTVALTRIDVPGAGDITYTLKGKCVDPSGTTNYIYNTSITIMAVKK